MKRTFATLGVVGLGLGMISVTAPATAASERVVVCHTDGSAWTPLEFDVNGIGGHVQHATDIIPPTPKAPEGKNWTDAGKLLYVEKCAALPPGEELPVVEQPVVNPPVVNPPVVEPPVVEQPVVEPPAVVTPVVETPVVAVEQAAVVPPAAVPPAAAPVVVPQTPAVVQPPVSQPRQQAAAVAGAGATAELGTNQGYNAQTAVGGSSSPSWLAGVGALLAAGAAVGFRRSRRTQLLAD
ncbi:LPXTG-motif cell wall-anchored protein [Pseudarthrobacter sp. W1I19]|uniref:LPXTG cell wall anchor domain-containing protein n=1 Tax=Pseudarthrobacter sp. W1I19 TaxID=3042288 RepID=UPI00278103BA|nr:LPXTG cell wall anchor domain-containing protein [Pseudarthrobacter sp. W1I19]MDQ0925790.1 LPXTG-motif cell wall-anchored protein [Pseudarthrobacter sp. W1I19]